MVRADSSRSGGLRPGQGAEAGGRRRCKGLRAAFTEGCAERKREGDRASQLHHPGGGWPGRPPNPNLPHLCHLQQEGVHEIARRV